MRKVIMVALALGLSLGCAAVKIESVRSVDLSKTSNQVSIDLSGPAQFKVQELSGGNGVRVAIQNVESVNIIPQYPRLSRVIDLINAYSDGTTGNVVIRTMGQYAISHSANSDNSRITVTIKAPGTTAPKPRPVQAPRTPAPAVAAPVPLAEPPLEEDVYSEPDSGVVDSILPLPPIPLTEEPVEPVQAVEPNQLNGLLKYIIPAIALILCVLVILKYFRKRPSTETFEIPETPAAPKQESSTLTLDSDTLGRMAKKLLEQGWTLSEIARELRLSASDVESIISRSSDESDES
ncbi:MAG: hypothetical protein K0B87_08675 [Candidatus Syntrophosphaera sp.]|nr:hypothetical protein [Candidatus Syntrophosphaera sp.]